MQYQNNNSNNRSPLQKQAVMFHRVLIKVKIKHPFRSEHYCRNLTSNIVDCYSNKK
jgi:hypothetical protein